MVSKFNLEVNYIDIHIGKQIILLSHNHNSEHRPRVNETIKFNVFDQIF